MIRMDEEQIDDPGPVSGLDSRKRKSAIWDFFTKQSDLDAQCNVCKKKLKTPTGTTTTLAKHLKQHATKYSDFEKRKNEEMQQRGQVPGAKSDRNQTKIVSHFSINIPYGQNSVEKKKRDEAIAMMMALDYQPYSLVEDRGFKALIKAFDPRYILPSRTTFSRSYIPSLYNKKKKEIQAIVGKSVDTLESVSFTTDGWTSSANDSYIGVTLHFLDDDFKYHSYTLSNAPFPGTHTARDIKKVLEDIADEWGILPTIPIYVLTDNARNYTAAINTTTSWQHVPCFAHTLQLTIHDANSDCAGVSRMFAKTRSVVGHYKKSPLANERLLEVQKSNGGQVLEVIQDVPTRWNSEFLMLDRFLTLRTSIATELAQSHSNIDSLSAAEFTLAEGVVSVLRPFAFATKELCGEKYPTLSMVLPALHCLEQNLVNHIEHSRPGTMYARALMKSLLARFAPLKSVENVTLKLATLLDPRFKAVLFELGEVKSLMIREVRRMIASDEPTQSPSASPSTQEPLEPDSNWWASFDILSQETTRQTSPVSEDDVVQEVKSYLQDPTLPRSINSFQWWGTEGRLKYPHLSRVARRYISIPATQASSERLFSTAGNIVTQRRTSLLPEHVEQLTFLHDNL